MEKELSKKIYAMRGRLTPQLRKLADCVLGNGMHSCFLNTRELAAAAGVSASAVVRFARRLGYDGFRSFKTHLQHAVRVQLSSSERLSKTVRSLKRRKLVYQVFEQDIALIESTLRLLNEEDFDRAVRQILTAKTVYVLGEKSSFALAYFLYFRLSRLGTDCKLIHFGGPAVFSELAPLKKGDVLLAIGFRMIPYEVCGAVKLAKAKRATVIAITSPPISPIAVSADIVLYVDRGNAEKIQSVTAGVALCHAIVIGVAARLGRRSTAILKEIDAAERARAEFTPEDYRV